ncbi:hypothetical protein XENOCAPTIV_000249 [Xenoophorus captivus]|uniref:Uncharacterized protein n=1 Tax=Xenoophorus captivus TaxID=1517983 RepID=A0ABV0QGP6_9TELE
MYLPQLSFVHLQANERAIIFVTVSSVSELLGILEDKEHLGHIVGDCNICRKWQAVIFSSLHTSSYVARLLVQGHPFRNKDVFRKVIHHQNCFLCIIDLIQPHNAGYYTIVLVLKQQSSPSSSHYHHHVYLHYILFLCYCVSFTATEYF